MVVIGADSHKRTHTVVALDEVGRRLGEKTVPTTSEGHLALAETPECADDDDPTPPQTEGPFFKPSSPVRALSLPTRRARAGGSTKPPSKT